MTSGHSSPAMSSQPQARLLVVPSCRTHATLLPVTRMIIRNAVKTSLPCQSTAEQSALMLQAFPFCLCQLPTLTQPLYHADIVAGQCLTVARLLGFLSEKAHPRTSAYLDRLTKRPTYVKIFGPQE